MKLFYIKIYCLICVILFLSSVVALRGETRDTIVYLHVFQATKNFPISPYVFFEEFSMEWGFGLLSWFVKLLNFEHYFLFFAISIFTFLFIIIASRNFGLNYWSVLPYYLPVFFLTQQFMQIRQGLAVAIAFYAISIITKHNFSFIKVLLFGLAASLFHVVALLPLIAAAFFSMFWYKLARYNHYTIIALAFILVLSAAHLVTQFRVFEAIERITVYIGDPEFAAGRSIFDVANVRAVCLGLIFLVFIPKKENIFHKMYLILVTIYFMHIAIRIGFLDFAILSGRLSTAFGFAEIFILAIAVKCLNVGYFFKLLFVVIYMLAHFYVALLVQMPFLVEDYFSPLKL